MKEGWPVLLRLWGIPGVVAVAALVGACIARRPWARRILVAIAVTAIIPVPLFSPDGGAFVPLGMFLMSPAAFPKAAFLIAIPVAFLSVLFWLLGMVIRLVRGRLKGPGQHPVAPYSEPVARSPQG